MKRNFAFFAGISLLVGSCTMAVPLEDDTSPEITFDIEGEGVNETFTTEDDYKNELVLLNEESYRFSLSANDQGGIDYIRWQLPENSTFEFETEIPPEWKVRNNNDGTRVLEWNGEEEGPIAGASIVGNFIAHREANQVLLEFETSDFGGADDEKVNKTTHTLRVLIIEE